MIARNWKENITIITIRIMKQYHHYNRPKYHLLYVAALTF